MKNIPLLVGTLAVTLLLVVGVGLMFSKSAEPKKVDQAELVENARHQQGNKDATIEVVEFSDFQCPACLATEPLVKEMLTKYGEKIEFTYRHFPLFQIHKNAQLAALAGEAASDFNKFWEMHDELFANQSEWEGMSDAEAKAAFIQYAEKIQIDKNQFQLKMESNDIKDRVAADVALGNSIGVNSTPTFYVNGVETSAPMLLSTIESLTKQ